MHSRLIRHDDSCLPQQSGLLDAPGASDLPRHKRSSEQSQNQEATFPALELNTYASHDTVVISSDEDSDSDDTGNAEDNEAEMADYLPSIPEIIAKHGVERSRADTVGE